MRKMIRGENLEDKLGSIDQHIWSLSRKVYKHATVITPAIPMGAFIDLLPADGTIFKFLVPADGFISRALMYVERVPKDVKPELFIRVVSAKQESTYKLPYKMGLNALKCDFALTSGDLIYISTSESALVGGIWMSLLYEMAVPEGCKKQFLVDEILSKYEEEEKKDGEQTGGQEQTKLDGILPSPGGSSDDSGVSDILRRPDSAGTDGQANNGGGNSGDSVQDVGDGGSSVPPVEEAL